MFSFSRDVYKKAQYIVPEFVVSPLASIADSTTLIHDSTLYPAGQNFSITVECMCGDVWVNPLAVATTDNGYRLTDGALLDIKVESFLSVISDSTLAVVQAFIWEV